MPVVFELYRRDGSVVFDGSTQVVKYLGEVTIQPTETGSITRSEFTANGANPFYTFLMDTGSYQPVVTFSGNTLSWQPSSAPNEPRYEGSRYAVRLLYGYF